MVDQELLEQYVQARSEDAFRELVARHAGMVQAICRRRLGDHQLAEDAAQAVFLVFSRKAAKLRGKTVISGWLAKTAKLISANLYRKIQTRTFHESRAPMLDAPQTEAFSELDDALAKLPARYRDAIFLHYYEGKSHAEAARELEITEATAQKRVSRGMAKLKALLGKSLGAVPALDLASHLQQSPSISLVSTVCQNLKTADFAPEIWAAAKEAEHMMWITKMKTFAMVGVGLVVAGYGGVQVVGAPKEQKKEPSKKVQNVWGEESDGLQVKLVAPKKKLQLGSALLVDLIVKNLRKESVVITPPRPKIFIEMKTPSGQIVKTSKNYKSFYQYAERLQKNTDAGPPRIELRQGQSHSLFDHGGIAPPNSPQGMDIGDLLAWSIDLPTGTYKLRLAYVDSQDRKVWSNSVDITFTDGPWGEISEELQYRLYRWDGKKQFKEGEKIFLNGLMRNTGDKEKQIWFAGFWPNHKIFVWDMSGAPVGLTKKGANARKAFAPKGGRDKNYPQTLPAKSIIPESAMEITSYFKLDKPGVYQVQFLYQEGDMAPLKSNIMQIEIVTNET